MNAGDVHQPSAEQFERFRARTQQWQHADAVLFGHALYDYSDKWIAAGHDQRPVWSYSLADDVDAFLGDHAIVGDYTGCGRLHWVGQQLVVDHRSPDAGIAGKGSRPCP